MDSVDAVGKMGPSEALDMLNEKTLHQKVDVNLVQYCPTMDLVALGSIDQHIMIYRVNGQRVYAAPVKAGAPRVDRLCWKPNGQLLAMASSDGSVRLISAESSKVVHHFLVGGQGVSGITCLDWASNKTGPKKSSAGKRLSAKGWGGLLGQDASATERTPLDLPRDLTLIDIETSLPRLSTLATTGGLDDVFSSRTSLDTLFQSFDPRDNNHVDVMVIGTKECDIHLTVYSSFEVGNFSTPLHVEGVPAVLVLHASHEEYSTHSLLMRSSGSPEDLYFVPMDLRFISASRNPLPLLASKSTALQNLLRYINQVQSLMVSEWRSTQELPGKFIRSIDEKLGEHGTHDIVQALYHTVATGHTFPSVRDWLVDELQERGHKRWDKAVTTGLENIRRLAHENMVPALDRCTVILSRFDGIAQFQGSNETVGYSSPQIARIADTVASLHLVSSKILAQVVDELDLFSAFSTWLRQEIDRLASESISDDATDKDALIDHSKVLLYLQTSMKSSSLKMYLGQASSDDYDQDGWKQVEQGAILFELLDKQIQKAEQGLTYLEALPRVALISAHLNQQCHTVFRQIADSEKRNVRFGTMVPIGKAPIDAPMDLTMHTLDLVSCSIYAAFVPCNVSNQVEIKHIICTIENGISSLSSAKSCTLQLGSGRVKDIKFLNEKILLVLWKLRNVSHLLQIAYTVAKPSSQIQVVYGLPKPPSKFCEPLQIDDSAMLETFKTFNLGTEATFVPEYMQIRRSAPGRFGTERIFLFEKDRLRYRVFQIADVQHKRDGNQRGVAMR